MGHLDGLILLSLPYSLKKKTTRTHMPSHMLINEKKCFQVSLSVCYCVLLGTIDLSCIAVNKLAASLGLGGQNTVICFSFKV